MTQTDNVLLFHEANSLEMLQLHYLKIKMKVMVMLCLLIDQHGYASLK